MIKFSIIVPLYNCEKYIAECINSIIKQEYKDFEIIVVNDGSTDNSRKIVEEYKDKRIRIVDKENGGLLHARLTGLQEAKNDYIVFIDADDRLRPNLLSDLQKQFLNGIDCVVYKLQEFTSKGEGVYPQGLFPDKTIFEDCDRQNLLKMLLTSGAINSIVCKSFKKELVSIREMLLYPRIAIGEDGLFTLQLFKNYSKLIYLDAVYYDYRQSSQSMTHKMKFSNYTDNVFRFNLYYETAKDYFSENLNELIKEINRLFFTMTISTLINKRSQFANKEDFYDIVESVSNSETFKKVMSESFKEQKFLYKIILKSIEKKKLGRLLLFRKLFSLLYRK